jgi:hypothetical protein
MNQNNSFTGLSPHLIASIYPMKRVGDGAAWARNDDQKPFYAPLTSATLDLSPNWQSPFEGAGVESSFPALAQMAQAGMFQGVLRAIGSKLPEGAAKSVTDEISAKAHLLVGRTGVTKLNSTQVFSGMQPVKIQMTAFLRAFKSAVTEVEDPLQRLQEWTLPKRLAKDGVFAEFIRSGADLLTLMPSEVPTIVGFAYKGRIFQPMVIESVSDPLDAPVDRYGRRISASVQITLCSLTALDQGDWANTYKKI